MISPVGARRADPARAGIARRLLPATDAVPSNVSAALPLCLRVSAPPREPVQRARRHGARGGARGITHSRTHWRLSVRAAARDARFLRSVLPSGRTAMCRNTFRRTSLV